MKGFFSKKTVQKERTFVYNEYKLHESGDHHG